MERRRLCGQDYDHNRQPTEDLNKQRIAGSVGIGSRQYPEDDRSIDSNDDDSSSRAFVQGSGVQLQSNAATDQTGLNRLRAGLMKAKLRNAPDIAMLEKNYDQAVAAFALGVSNLSTKCEVVLDASHSRLLAGTRAQIQMTNTTAGKKRERCEANDNASIEDMVREERRTRAMAGGEGLRIAERISKDINFNDSLEYLDENAEKLARRTQKSGSTLKSIATHEYTRMNKILESCPLCHHEDRSPPRDLPLAPIVSLASCTFLTLSTEPELTGAEGGAVIVPIDHHTNLLECDDDEWEEIRNFMKSLTRLYHDQGRDVIFYENAAAPQRRKHAALVAVPIPYELGNTAPAFFREAMLSADEEWSQHIKIIDTEKRAREGLGKSAFRKCIAKEMPYFHAWFSLDGGLGHIVEDGKRWPKGDLFAREVIGGMLDVDTSIVNRQGRWIEFDPRLGNFKRRWKRFDWTRVLAAS
ncbi:MAG: Pre-mRNA-splicing factor cwf19 [Sporothrix epigloea]